MQSPDQNSSGFLASSPDALRYDFLSEDPDDAGIKLAKFVTPGSRFLDVGCGTGVITDLIRRRSGANAVGIEPDADRVARAKERGLEVHQGFLTPEFILEHGPFDFIVFADVLEHLSNPGEIVRISKMGLKPGGSILASVPNVAHWFVRTDLLRGNFNYQDCGIMDATHLRWFTRQTICDLFKAQGFEIGGVGHTVNIALPDYSRRVPWRILPLAMRRKLVGVLCQWFPGVFGCQLVVRAVLAPGDGRK